MIAGQLALNRYEKEGAKKRGENQIPLVLDELAECVSGEEHDLVDMLTLKTALNRFLAALPRKTRNVFVRRYWYAASLSEIASEFHMTEGSLAVLLHRTREKLRIFLQKEGVDV